MIACMTRPITLWKQGFYELLGSLYQQPIDATNNIDESIPPESITKTLRVPRYPPEPVQQFINDCLNYESPSDE
jgi:hypothetical protein